jgi:hypothetical protein
VTNPGYAFSEDGPEAMNPMLLAGAQMEPDDLYDTQPGSQPVNGDGGYFYADSSAPALPDKRKSYTHARLQPLSHEFACHVESSLQFDASGAFDA